MDKLAITLSLFLALAVTACSTCKCKTIDDQGKVRDASDPAPTAAEKPTAPVTTTDAPAVAANSGTTTTAAASSAAPTPAPTTTQTASPTPPAETAAPAGNVRVYKYDNSRQCGQGKAVELDEMAKQLKNIKVISQEKKNDGMMRIQMCGAPTGIANVYEIEGKDLKKAIKAGFREWKYSPQ